MIEIDDQSRIKAQHRWAHDLRNAMNSISLCTSAFDVCDELDEQLEMLEQIELSTVRMNTLLDVSPFEENGSQPQE